MHTTSVKVPPRSIAKSNFPLIFFHTLANSQSKLLSISNLSVNSMRSCTSETDFYSLMNWLNKFLVRVTCLCRTLISLIASRVVNNSLNSKQSRRITQIEITKQSVSGEYTKSCCNHTIYTTYEITLLTTSAEYSKCTMRLRKAQIEIAATKLYVNKSVFSTSSAVKLSYDIYLLLFLTSVR